MFPIVVGDTIEDCMNEGNIRSTIRDFGYLDVTVQEQIVLRVLRAQKAELTRRVSTKEDMNIPYLCNVRIKPGKRNEVKVMEDVAKELGYDSIADIPKDDYKRIREEKRDLILSLHINQKETSKLRNRTRSKQIRAFNLNKIKKNKEM